MLEDRRERRDTDTCTDKDGNLGLEDILGGSTIRTIDTNGWERTADSSWIKLNEITSTTNEAILDRLVILLRGLHRGLRNGGDDAGCSPNPLSEGTGEVTNLADVYRDIGVLGGGCDGEGMPLESRDVGALEEQPLASGVLEAGFYDTELHGAGRMDQDLRELRLLTGPNFSPDALAKVDEAGPDSSPPAHVAETNIWVVIRERAGETRLGSASNEASNGMGVETDHEEEGKVVGVPESLEALLANLVVCRAVHDDHDEEHNMSGDSTWLAIVDVEGV